MDKRKVGYWAATVLIALPIAFGGAIDLIAAPEALEVLKHLGYPAYFAHIIGFWKVLGAIVLVVPGLPRLKEWAYAGILFDVTGAAVSHAFVGDPPSNVIIPLVLAAILGVSWWLRPASRKLQPPGQLVTA